MTGGFQVPQASPAKARAALDLRWQAHLVAEQLLCPDLSPAVSVDMLAKAFLDPVAYARLQLTMAEWEAQNNTPAEPDTPGAAAFCGWCGSTVDLVDDSLMPGTGERLDAPVWMCADTDACVDRRKARYPDRLDLIQAAQDRLDLAMAQAAPTVLALSAVQAALHHAASQDQAIALSAPRSGSSSRPAPLTGAAYQAARWSHTLTSPAHRAHLLSAAPGAID
jgi:hypothetical protein